MTNKLVINTPKAFLYSILPMTFLETGKNRAAGPDLSHWEISYDPDLSIHKTDFAITKATEGSNWIDPSLDHIWTGIQKLSIRGLYHYQRSFGSWKTQANHFMRIANRYYSQIWALDVEKINNSVEPTFFQDSYRIIQHWKEWAPSNVKIVLYTNPDIFQNYLYPNWVKYFGKAGETEAQTIPFWIAQYWKVASPDKDPGMPRQRQTWDLWQWTGNGPAKEWGSGAKGIDLNVFNGGVDEMQKWLGSETTPTPPPPLEPTPETKLWKALVVSRFPVKVRPFPKVDPTNSDQQFVYFNESFVGKLWVGNDYVWMKITDISHPFVGMWVAVRSFSGTPKFLKLFEVDK